ncbi:MAG: hypothetical protein GXW85_10550 [Clostridia bacterium]|nr:hypothetical protein [Clostridia bacterium]
MKRLDVIQKKVSLVFQLIDDYTEKSVVTARVRESTGCCQAINKRDGYYVFINLEPKEYIFTIEAPNFLKVTKKIDLALAQEPVIIKVRLQHGVFSNLLNNATRILGRLDNKTGQPQANHSFMLAVISKANNLRLVEDAKKGSTKIKVYGGDKYSLEGRKLLIAEKEKYSFIEIEGYDPEEDCFRLNQPLDLNYKTGAVLYHSWQMETNHKGEFMLPIPLTLINEDKTLKLKVFIDSGVIDEELIVSLGDSNRLIIKAV